MKLPKIILAVVSLHVVLIGALIVTPGCHSRVERQPEILANTQSPSSSVYYTPQEQSNVHVDPAFNANIPVNTVSSSASSQGLSAPTRPSVGWDDINNVEMATAPLGTDPVSTDPVSTAPVSAVPAADTYEAQQPSVASSYTVVRGDTLWGIAQKHQVSVQALLTVNGLNKNAVIQPGQILSIPRGSESVVSQQPAVSSAPAPNPVDGESHIYIVMPGDTLGKIARKFGTSASALQTLNNISNPRLLRAGQELLVPGADALDLSAPSQPSAPAKPAPTFTSKDGLIYKVQRGETLGRISRKFGVGVKELMDLNGIPDPRLLREGQELLIKRAPNESSLETSSDALVVETVEVPEGADDSNRGDVFDDFSDIVEVEVQNVE